MEDKDYKIYNEAGLLVQETFIPKEITTYTNKNDIVVIEFNSENNPLCLNFIDECFKHNLQLNIRYTISEVMTIYINNGTSYITIPTSDEKTKEALKSAIDKGTLKFAIKDPKDELLMFIG